MWKEVKNGKICPKDFDPLLKNCKIIFYLDNRNEKIVRIPLMLRTIGGLINDYKPMPLFLFERGLRITIQLNPEAFSIYSDNGANFNKEKIFPLIQPMLTDDARKYRVKNCYLETLQLNYEDDYIKSVKKSVDEGLYRQYFVEPIIWKTTYMNNVPNYDIVLNCNQQHVTKIQAIITNDNYRYSPFAKSLDRFNLGIKNFTITYLDYRYPPITAEKHNSLNTFGDQNCAFFYEELKKGLEPQFTDSDYGLNKTNFCVEGSDSFILSLLDFKARNDVNNNSNKSAINDNANLTNPEIAPNLGLERSFELIIKSNYNLGGNIGNVNNDINRDLALNAADIKYGAQRDMAWCKAYSNYIKFIRFKNANAANPLYDNINLTDYVHCPEIATACKTIYSLNFENTKRRGFSEVRDISFKFENPIVLSLERIDDFWKRYTSNVIYF